jgi:hypothetical protein
MALLARARRCSRRLSQRRASPFSSVREEEESCDVHLHADLSFASDIQKSDISSKWYGEPSKLVAALFSVATKLQPCIIFVDEVHRYGEKKKRRAEEIHDTEDREERRRVVRGRGKRETKFFFRWRVCFVRASRWTTRRLWR